MNLLLNSYILGNPIVGPVYKVGEVNARLSNQATSSTGRSRQAFNIPFELGTDLKDIVLSYNNWWFDITGNGALGSERGTGNSYTIEEVCIYSTVSNIVVPVTFSGLRSKTFTSATNDSWSDAVLPASFSLSKFSKGEQYWIKGIASVPVAGNLLPSNTGYSNSDITNTQHAWYDPAVTTPSATDTVGVYTATGTAFTSVAQGVRPIVLGQPFDLGSNISLIAVGDSIGHHQLDSNAGYGGRGFLNRGIYNYGKNTYPFLNLCTASGRTTLFVGSGNTLWRAYIKYADYAIDQMGTNPVNDNIVLATMQTQFTTLWGILKTGGISRIYRTELMCNTTSTDNWATEANQTVVANWGPGEVVDQLHAWFATKVTDLTLHRIIKTDGVKNPTNKYKWKTDDISTVRYTANDALHPSANGHQFAAWEVREALIAEQLQNNLNDLNHLSNIMGLFTASDPTTLLDANGIASNAGGFLGKVATWQNKIGSYHGLQSTDSRRPTMGVKSMNGIAIPDFDGTDDRMTVDTLISNFGASTIFTVYVADNTDQTSHVFANAGSSAATRWFSSNQSTDMGLAPLLRPSPETGVNIIQCSRVNGTGAGARTRYNANLDAQMTGTQSRSNNAGLAVQIGAYGTGSAGWFNGGIAAIVVFHKQLTPSETNFAASKLQAIFGTQLATVLY